MFQFQGFNLLDFDLPRYHKTLDRTMSQIIREAARQWLRTILRLGVPVETGMAKAALVPVGRFLSNVNVRGGGLSINPTRVPYYSKLYGTMQRPEAGIERQSFALRDNKSHPLSFIYSFEWSTEVLHWYLGEFYHGKAMAGEDAIRWGEEAFLRHIQTKILERLPHVAEFING